MIYITSKSIGGDSVNIEDPISFCYWLHYYLVSGGKDLDKIQEFVEIPIKANMEAKNAPHLTYPYKYGLIGDVLE